MISNLHVECGDESVNWCAHPHNTQSAWLSDCSRNDCMNHRKQDILDPIYKHTLYKYIHTNENTHEHTDKKSTWNLRIFGLFEISEYYKYISCSSSSFAAHDCRAYFIMCAHFGCFLSIRDTILIFRNETRLCSLCIIITPYASSSLSSCIVYTFCWSLSPMTEIRSDYCADTSIKKTIC